MIKTILSRNGYKIKKSELNIKTLKEMKKFFCDIFVIFKIGLLPDL